MFLVNQQTNCTSVYMMPCAANEEQQQLYKKNIFLTTDQTKADFFNWEIISLIGVGHKCHSDLLHVLLSYSSVPHYYSAESLCILRDYLK